MTKGKWITINEHRYNLTTLTLIWQGHKWISPNVYREAIYFMPVRKDVIVQTYSTLLNPLTNSIRGTEYHAADATEVAQLAKETGDLRLAHLLMH